MTSTAVKRSALALVAAVALWAAAAWIGLRPRPVLLVLTVVAAFVCTWLIEDLGAESHDLDLAAPRRRVVPRWGLDPRFSRLAAALRPPHDAHLVAAQVHATLVPIVDERLLARHGIDRAAEPERARALMDPKLTAYVENPPQPRRSQLAYLSDIITRIEDL
jgi:hypothetical protein